MSNTACFILHFNCVFCRIYARCDTDCHWILLLSSSALIFTSKIITNMFTVFKISAIPYRIDRFHHKIPEVTACILPLVFHITFLFLIAFTVLELLFEIFLRTLRHLRILSIQQNMNVAKHKIAFKKPYTALGDSALLSRQALRVTSGGLLRLQDYKTIIPSENTWCCRAPGRLSILSAPARTPIKFIIRRNMRRWKWLANPIIFYVLFNRIVHL